METLTATLATGVKAEHAGLFVSAGQGIHPDRIIASHELILVRSGTLHIAEEGRDFAIGADEALLLWPGRRHRGTRAYEKNLSFYWGHFQLEPIPAQTGGSVELPQHTRVARPERMAELFHRLLDAQESRVASAIETTLLMALLLAELQRREPVGTTAAGSALAGRSDRYVAENFRRGLHAGDVAGAMGCNPDYLGRVYREAYGCTLSEAIHRRQLKEARTLLRESTQNIEEVALACGFREARYFRKLFTEQQGVSPRDYRKLHARVHINTR